MWAASMVVQAQGRAMEELERISAEKGFSKEEIEKANNALQSRLLNIQNDVGQGVGGMIAGDISKQSQGQTQRSWFNWFRKG